MGFLLSLIIFTTSVLDRYISLNEIEMFSSQVCEKQCRTCELINNSRSTRSQKNWRLFYELRTEIICRKWCTKFSNFWHWSNICLMNLQNTSSVVIGFSIHSFTWGELEVEQLAAATHSPEANSRLNNLLYEENACWSFKVCINEIRAGQGYQKARERKHKWQLINMRHIKDQCLSYKRVPYDEGCK